MTEILIVSGKLKTTPSFSSEHQLKRSKFLTWTQQMPDRCSALSELLGIGSLGFFVCVAFSIFFSPFIFFSPLRGSYETLKLLSVKVFLHAVVCVCTHLCVCLCVCSLSYPEQSLGGQLR